jgi:tRNA (guanine37-N1)-methyltransferase
MLPQWSGSPVKLADKLPNSQLMRFDLITLFPDFFTSPLGCGLMSKALAKQIASVHITNPRDFTTDRHHKVDDESYGGGVGMVIKPEPIFAAVESLPILERSQVLLMSPQGRTMDRDLFQDLAVNYDRLVLICGHYEGIDERVMNIVDREISLGDFVLTCGEIPALALINGVIRLLPGTVGKAASLTADSFEDGLLDYPHYTRPQNFRGWRVPEVLMSGNHAKIAQWRHQQQLDRTQTKRPDLYTNWLANLDTEKPPLD